MERVRQLSKRLKDSGGSVTEIEKRMKEIDKMIAAGTVVEGIRMLDQVIRDLEKPLEKSAGQLSLQRAKLTYRTIGSES